MSLFNYRYLEANVADVNLVDLHRVKNIKCIPTSMYVRTYLLINFALDGCLFKVLSKV